MNVNFETIRIGEFRSSRMTEKLLKQNHDLLKIRIEKALTPVHRNASVQEIGVDIVIPEKGADAKIALDGIQDKEVKVFLRQHFPAYIYRGGFDKVMDNLRNPLFPLWVLERNNSEI